MSNKAYFAVSVTGVAMLAGAISYADSTISLVMFALKMIGTYGVREILGYLVVTGIISGFSILAIPLLFVTGTILATGAWIDPKDR